MILISLLLLVSAEKKTKCEHGTSADGRFCCPQWCEKSCGGDEHVTCPTAMLQEVGLHPCGEYAPPCLLQDGEEDEGTEADDAVILQAQEDALEKLDNRPVPQPRKQASATVVANRKTRAAAVAKNYGAAAMVIAARQAAKAGVESTTAVFKALDHLEGRRTQTHVDESRAETDEEEAVAVPKHNKVSGLKQHKSEHKNHHKQHKNEHKEAREEDTEEHVEAHTEEHKEAAQIDTIAELAAKPEDSLPAVDTPTSRETAHSYMHRGSLRGVTKHSQYPFDKRKVTGTIHGAGAVQAEEVHRSPVPLAHAYGYQPYPHLVDVRPHAAEHFGRVAKHPAEEANVVETVSKDEETLESKVEETHDSKVKETETKTESTTVNVVNHHKEPASKRRETTVSLTPEIEPHHVETYVRLDLPAEGGDVAVDTEARQGIEDEMRKHLADLDAKIADGLHTVEQEAATVASAMVHADAAAHAEYTARASVLSGDTLLGAANLTSPPLFAKLLPGFDSIQDASANVLEAEHAYEATNGTAARHASEKAVRESIMIAKEASAHRVELTMSLKELNKLVDTMDTLSKNAKEESGLQDVDPGLLDDLERLRGVAFLESGSEGGNSSGLALLGRAAASARGQLTRVEEQYRSSLRTVAALRVERRVWAKALDQANGIEKRIAPLTASRSKDALTDEENHRWGEVKLGDAASSWAAAAGSGSLLAHSKAEKFERSEHHAAAAAKIMAHVNASLFSALSRAATSLEMANQTLVEAYTQYRQEEDVGADSLMTGYNETLHALAKSLATTLEREQAVKADNDKVQKSMLALETTTPAVALAGSAATNASTVFAAAADSLAATVDTLRRDEAAGSSDRAALLPLADSPQ